MVWMFPSGILAATLAYAIGYFFPDSWGPSLAVLFSLFYLGGVIAFERWIEK